MDIPELPHPVSDYFAAKHAGDMEALARCFAEDAELIDERQTISGRVAIKAWLEEAGRKYRYVAEPQSVTRRDGRVVVPVRLTGDFPGSPLVLDHSFALAGDQIAALEIG